MPMKLLTRPKPVSQAAVARQLKDKAEPFETRGEKALREYNGPFDGTSAIGAIPMPHDKTWLEVNGLRKESIADDYCALVDRYLRGGWDYKEFHAAMSSLGKERASSW